MHFWGVGGAYICEYDWVGANTFDVSTDKWSVCDWHTMTLTYYAVVILRGQKNPPRVRGMLSNDVVLFFLRYRCALFFHDLFHNARVQSHFF